LKYLKILYNTLLEYLEMDTKLSLMVYISAAMLVAGMVAGFNILPAKTVLAASSTSTTANDFGEGASQLGQSGQTGTHSSSTQGGGEQTQPRSGIGNVGSNLCGERLTPGQLAGVLNTLSSTGQLVCP
jgi:hypothetical protein